MYIEGSPECRNINVFQKLEVYVLLSKSLANLAKFHLSEAICEV